MRDKFTTACFAAAIFLGVLPLWAGGHLPLVDLPQHLHLISVLHRLHDSSTLYPEWFEARGQLTPYLGYYVTVSALNWLMPLELANRLFLSAYVAALPLSLAFLLRSFKRPTWPALLSLPFAYGDSFAWGFINYIAALPLSFLTCGLFVRTLTDVAHRRRWAILLGLSLVSVLLMHVQAFAWLGIALPILLLTTPVPEDRPGLPLKARFLPRLPVLLGVLPGVLLFIVWVGLRVGEPTEVEKGAVWKAWGPMLSPENLAFKSYEQNVAEFPSVLANMLRDGSDRGVLTWVVVVAIAGLVLGLYELVTKERARLSNRRFFNFAAAVLLSGAALLFALKNPIWPPDSGARALKMIALLVFVGAAVVATRFYEERPEAPSGGLRLLLIVAAGAALYLYLPFDIRGYMYYLNTRYAHLVAPLAICCVPAVSKKLERGLLVAGVVVALVLCLPLYRGFSKFDGEAQDFDRVEAAAAPKATVMGFIFDTGSAVMTHPVYLHMGAELARKSGGIANFSFALTPHSPLKYRRTPPPAPVSEWQPGQFNWSTMGPAYDHFLIRGPAPERLMGGLLGSELYVAAQSGNVSLVRRR